MTAARSASAIAKNRPLVEDIRFLGRLLGAVIREQDGPDAYAVVERIRKLSVDYRLKANARAGQRLICLLRGLTLDQAVSVIGSSAISPIWRTSPRPALHPPPEYPRAGGPPPDGCVSPDARAARRAGYPPRAIAATLERAKVRLF